MIGRDTTSRPSIVGSSRVRGRVMPHTGRRVEVARRPVVAWVAWRGRGWCNGSTRSFGVLCRGSNPRPRATTAELRPTPTDRDTDESIPTSRRDRAGRRGGLADPVGHPEGPARAVRPPDGVARRRRARGAPARARRHRGRPRRRARHQDAPGTARHRGRRRVRRTARASAAPATRSAWRSRRAHSTTSTPRTTSSCCPATIRC